MKENPLDGRLLDELQGRQRQVRHAALEHLRAAEAGTEQEFDRTALALTEARLRLSDMFDRVRDTARAVRVLRRRR